jgi:quercetin dioxygenase-like cupin family protein
MAEEQLFRRGTILVRRLHLAPGEAMPWHRDPFHRITVVLAGDVLAIEGSLASRRRQRSLWEAYRS